MQKPLPNLLEQHSLIVTNSNLNMAQTYNTIFMSLRFFEQKNLFYCTVIKPLEALTALFSNYNQKLHSCIFTLQARSNNNSRILYFYSNHLNLNNFGFPDWGTQIKGSSKSTWISSFGRPKEAIFISNKPVTQRQLEKGLNLKLSGKMRFNPFLRQKYFKQNTAKPVVSTVFKQNKHFVQRDSFY